MAHRTLLLVRHAVAEPRGPAWPDDRRRPLTEDGRAAFARLAAHVAPRLRPDLILTSGWTRARQTARLLADAGAAPVLVRRSRTLEPGGDPGRVLAQLRRLDTGLVVALIGHEPDLSRLAASLTGAAPRRKFRKGAIWQLQMRRLEPGGGRVSRVYAPVDPRPGRRG